jgi:hypothetical protein
MNANQNASQQVVILGFSICGIGGFKTVAAQGSSAEKRVYSALNQIDKELKRSLAHLDEKSMNVSEMSDQYKDELITLHQNTKYAHDVLTGVRDQISVQSDFTIIEPSKNTIATVTTQEFFDRADEIYANNASHFVMHSKEINAALYAHVEARRAKGATKARNMTPYLCLITGPSFFGQYPKDTPYPIILSKSLIDEAGGDTVKAVQDFCMRAIAANKNFRLTDYLRAERDEQRAKIRAEIFRLDAFLDEVGQIKVVSSTCLMSLSANSKNTARDKTMQSATAMLQYEAEQSVMLHILAHAKLADQLDGSCEPVQPASPFDDQLPMA